MKKITISFIVMIIVTGLLKAKDDDKKLLKAFHDTGITKCDNFILKHSKLNKNWNYYLSSHNKSLGKGIKETSIIQIYGRQNDTVKIDHSYIQTEKGCFLSKRSTLSFAGSCEENIDGNYWYVSNEMENLDYTTYKTSRGVERHAKEIQLGNFKACIQETFIRLNSPLEKN